MNKKIAIIAMVLPAAGFLVYAFFAFFTGLPSPVDVKVLDRELGDARLSVVFKADGAIPEGGTLAAVPGGDILFSAGANIMSLARGGGLLAPPDPEVTSFALTSEGILLTVRGGSLGYLYDGRAVDAVPLPAPGMRLEPIGKDRFCLYGKLKEGVWAAYAIEKGGRYAKLFTFPKEISAITASGDGFIFAAHGSLYRVSPGGRVLPMLLIPTAPRIRSIAYDPGHEAAYLSTMKAVYVLARNRMKKLADVSGTLRLESGALYILSDGTQQLLRIDGIFK